MRQTLRSASCVHHLREGILHVANYNGNVINYALVVLLFFGRLQSNTNARQGLFLLTCIQNITIHRELIPNDIAYTVDRLDCLPRLLPQLMISKSPIRIVLTNQLIIVSLGVGCIRRALCGNCE